MWGEDECTQLWEDVLNFFNTREETDEYFLGSVVMYKENNLQNLIDGQQRTTTLSLLIRALYSKAQKQTSSNITKLIADLSSCLWDINGLSGEIDFTKNHLRSEVAIDSDNDLLSAILSDKYELPNEIPNDLTKIKSKYEANYLFFIKKIDEFAKERPVDWFDLCLCLLKQCIILPIECDGQENALRIFNTLNNRGVSLGVADIFKGIIYQSKSVESRKEFATQWKELENKIANSNYLRRENITFLFTQYEHIIRASHNEVDTVIPSTLEFFTQKDKSNSNKKRVNFAANDDLLTKDETFTFIQEFAEFWCEPKSYMSANAQKYFDILNLYQNKIWQMVLSMCYYIERPIKNTNTANIFDKILPQIVSYLAIALIYSKGGSNGIFWGLMKANVNLKDKKEKIFESGLAIPDVFMPKLDYFIDFSSKALPKQVRYILAIYTLIYDERQEWEWNSNNKNYSVVKGEIEHIFPKKWQEANYNNNYSDEKDADNHLKQIGNQILIEKRLNIQAGNGYFARKKEVYKDSHFIEVQHLAQSANKDWAKEDIEKRNKEIHGYLDRYFREVLLENR